MPQAIPLNASIREVLGKKVKKLRREGVIPAHVYGNKVNTEHVSVKLLDFQKVLKLAGETGLIDLKVGEGVTRPVLIRGVQVDPFRGGLLHIDFYQVNLKEKVTVSVPIVLEGDEPEKVHTGEAVVIQPLNEVEVEALPTNLPEHLVANISKLVEIDDSVLVSDLVVPEGVTILAEMEAVVVKLDKAVTAEMEALMAEQQAETEAAQAEVAPEGEAPAEGEEAKETDVTEAGETDTESKSADEKPESAEDKAE